MADAVPPDAVPPGVDATGDGGIDPDVEHEAWRHLLFWVGLAELVVAGAMLVVAGRLYFPVAVFVPALVVALGLLVRPGRAGPVAVGVVSLILVVTNLRLVVEDLAHPDTFVTFFPAATGLVAALVGVVAMVGFLRRWPVRAVGRIGVVACAVVLVALAIGLTATASVEDDAPQEGDLAVLADGDQWRPDTITAREAGDVAVFVTNGDLRRHTFTIDELDLAVEIPADTTRRVTFTAPTGEYEFRSTVPGQDDMTGTLTVPD